MKKTFPICLLATSLLAINQLAVADNDPTKICPSLADIQNLPLKRTDPAQGKDRYNISTDYQNKNEYVNGDKPFYKYTYYTFYVRGVKGTDAEDAIHKVKSALSAAATQQPIATRVDPSSYYFNCVYSLDFSQSGDEYNGVYPVAIVEISGTDTQNLYAVPKNLNIGK